MRKTLPLHPLKNGDPYYIGVFMTGAYQDIMGDLHNLFGRVNEAHVSSTRMKIPVSTSKRRSAVIRFQRFWNLRSTTRTIFVRTMKEQINRRHQEDRLKPNEGMRLLSEYEKGLTDRTYLSVPGK